jgi:hypothetical protein
VRLLHSAGVVRAVFGYPNLVSSAGLEPVMRLAESYDLHGIVAERLHVCAVPPGIPRGGQGGHDRGRHGDWGGLDRRSGRDSTWCYAGVFRLGVRALNAGRVPARSRTATSANSRGSRGSSWYNWLAEPR